MKFTSALITLSVSAVLFSGVVRAAITGTDSVQMTFKTTVTTGTCKAIVVNGDGKNVSTIGYGETYKSDLNKKAMPGFAPIFPDTCYHLTHYWPAAADIPV
ncbi:fimbrial protein, partial [Salmonella enterica]|nr:fimbrial protein [Salmonella enterica]MCQ8081335.1 fimbrial protein [Salmonella enterica]MCQ8085892.1 fimbrial protein [Salmonella enterica]MCQ8170900.1 fimbrial protein [Salmonella enterica]